MPETDWTVRLTETEYKNAPLILSCASIILLLSMPRDYIVNGSMPLTYVVVNIIAVIGFAVIMLWSLRPESFKRHIKLVMILAAGLLCIKSVTMVVVDLRPYPFVSSVLIFGLSLFSLSRSTYLVSVAVVILAWSGVALALFPISEFATTLVLLVVSGFLGLLVLDRRIASFIKIYRLEARVESLETLLPMCSGCKKTRDEQGAWKSVEQYIEEKRGTQVSHSICPDCYENLYGDFMRSRGEDYKSGGA